MIDRQSLYHVLDAVIQTHGSQRAAAKALSVSDAYLSDVRHGRREAGAKLLYALGYKRVVMYEQIQATVNHSI